MGGITRDPSALSLGREFGREASALSLGRESSFRSPGKRNKQD